MVEDMLVGNSLTSEMITSGKELITILDKKNFLIKAALWIYFPDNLYWILLIGIPGLDTKGPKKAYKSLFPILHQNPDLNLSLMNIKLIDSSDDFISLLRTAINTGEGISGIRFTRNIINGFLIEDAYIYRLI